MAKSVALVLCLGIVALCPGATRAGPILDNLNITVTEVGVGSMPLTPADLNCTEDTGAGTATCMGAGPLDPPSGSGFEWQLRDWTIMLAADPVVNSNFAFQNVSASAQSFVITLSVGATPIPGGTLMGGSTGGSVTDSSNDATGGLETATPSPFYVGLIDGSPVAGTALHADPFFAPGPGFPGTFAAAGDTVNIANTSFGLPGPSAPGPAVAVSIGIRNEFRLAAGDSVASTNFFQVVPEPGTAGLLGLALAGLALIRRRT